MDRQTKVQAAIDYLKSRGIYILDGKFTPTNPAATDVAATVARYRAQVIGGKRLRSVKEGKGT